MKRLLPLIALASSVALVTQAIDSQKVLGISPELVVKYSGNVFECFDGSRTIPISAVNDDYCDCPGDGSDEPGKCFTSKIV